MINSINFSFWYFKKIHNSANYLSAPDAKSLKIGSKHLFLRQQSQPIGFMVVLQVYPRLTKLYKTKSKYLSKSFLKRLLFYNNY